MKHVAGVLSVLVSLLSGCSAEPPLPIPHASVVGEFRGAPVYRREILSEVFTMDKVYKSMQGPQDARRLRLGRTGPNDEAELLWLTGFDGSVLQPDGETEMSTEFLCHTNLDIDPQSYLASVPTAIPASSRLFTLSQGLLSSKIPEGFGVPVNSKEWLLLNTQALNHHVVGSTVKVRHKIAIEFVRDSDLDASLRPLIQQNVFGYVLVDGQDGHYGLAPNQSVASDHPGCLPGTHAKGADSRGYFKDEHGRKFSSFWMVPPGRHTYRSRVLEFMMKLPYDTTIHFAVSHLHPFAESLELRDLTTGETLIKTGVRQAEGGRLGIAELEYFTSDDGITVRPGHEYELISIYDNTTDEVHDAMAVMYLYVLAKDFSGLGTLASTSN